MKRIFATMLCVSVLLTCIAPFSASAEEETVYGTIPVQFSPDLEESVEYLDVMVQDGAVYVDCQAFAERLGYDVEVGESKVSITDSTGWYESSHSTTSIELPYESTQVNKTFCGGNWCTRLESPFPTIYDGETVWVPLEYTALLLNSSVKPLEDRVFITMPEKKVPDLIYDVLHPTLSYFTYDWADAYENDLGGFFASTSQRASSWVVSRLNRVLKMDIWDNIRRVAESGSLAGLTTTAEYGEKYATLFCTFSNDELKAETEKVSAETGIFSDAIGDMVSDTSNEFDGDLGSLKNKLDSLKKQLSSGDKQVVNAYNAIDLEIEKLDKKYSAFEKAFSPYSKVQKGLEKPIKVLDVLCYAVDFVNYESEFYSQDKNSVAILKKHLEHQENLSSPVSQGIEGQLTALEKEGFNYGIIRSGFDIAGDAAEDGFTKLLGLPATVVLVAWDLISNTVPFYTEGFGATDNFELSEVGIHVSRDSQSLLIKKETPLTQGTELQNYYELAQYSYNWLKGCYISRAAAIASLETVKTKKNVPEFIDSQQNINKQVAWYLVRLKDISDPAALKAGEIIDQYGMFPEANQKYLADYSEQNVDATLIQMVEEKKDSETNDWKQAYESFLKAKEYRAITDKWEEEYSPTDYAYIDIDQNGIDELIIIGNDSSGFGSFAVYSYTPEKNVYLIEGMEYDSWNDSWKKTDSFYCFGVPSYISRTASLVFDTVRPGTYGGGYQFYNLENGVLRYSYQIIRNAIWDAAEEEYDWIIDYADSTTPKNISEEDALSHLDSEEYLDCRTLP